MRQSDHFSIHDDTVGTFSDIGHIYKFTALPGTAKDKYAVRITSVVREEEE